ncbi:MAG: hypothetical protein C0631_13985 [Sedimenticola sp.]|nr:MAG: hypothetical protein C0631_13985 [Sedimenticola sp.]
MCTLVLLRRPNHKWPLLLGANRDEMIDRPWLAPERHWPDRPQVVAGKDQIAGGSWLGMNDHGVLAGVMNRSGTLGSKPGKRSRGELILQALDFLTAADAIDSLADTLAEKYQAFNLVVADSHDAFWISHQGTETSQSITCENLPEGVSMLTSMDLNDPRSPRINTYLPKFRSTEVPDPDAENGWRRWAELLADRTVDPKFGPTSAINVRNDKFSTLSSSLIALPSEKHTGAKPIWLFSSGPPDEAPFYSVDL